MGSDLSVVLQTCVPSPDGLVKAFQDAGLVQGSDPLCYIELRLMKADAAVQFMNDAKAASASASATSSSSRNQVFLLVSNCYSYVVGSSTSKAAGSGEKGGGQEEKDPEQDAVYDQVRRAMRQEKSCRKRIGLVVDPSVQLGLRVQEPQQGYRFARGTSYFLSSLLTALEYDVPRDEEIWTLSESPAPTLYLLDVRHNGLDDYSGPWLTRDVLERVRRVRHHALTTQRQALVHARIAQRRGDPDAPRLPPPPKMISAAAQKHNDSVVKDTSTAVVAAPRRPSTSSMGTSDILAAMDGYSDDGTSGHGDGDVAKKDLIFDIPIYMPNVRSDLFMGSLQCVLLSDNDLTLNGVDQILGHLFETEQQATARMGSAGALTTTKGSTAFASAALRGSQPNSTASADRQLVVASDASRLLLPYLLLIDVRRNAFNEIEAESLLRNKVGAVVDAREMTVLDAPGKPPPELSPLEKQRIALEKKTEEHRLQKEEAKRRKEEKKRKLEEERQKVLEERKRAMKEKAARQREREAAEKKQREQEQRELLAAMDALRRGSAGSAPPSSAPAATSQGEAARARAAPSDAGDWLDDEGGLMQGDVPDETAAPPPPPLPRAGGSTSSSHRRPQHSPRSPQPTGAPPSRDQQPSPTPKRIAKVRALSADDLEADPDDAPPQLKDKNWSPQYNRRGSRTPRQPLPTSQSPRGAPPPQDSPERVFAAASTSPSPSPAQPQAHKSQKNPQPRAEPAPLLSSTAPRQTRQTAPAPQQQQPQQQQQQPKRVGKQPMAAAAPSPSSTSPRTTSRAVEEAGTPLASAPPSLPDRRQQQPQQQRLPRTSPANVMPPPQPRRDTPAESASAEPQKQARSQGARGVPQPNPAARAVRAPQQPDETISCSSSSDIGDEDLLWVDPYTGAALTADPEFYPAVRNEAPDVVRARRGYSSGRGQTPRRLASRPAADDVPPPLRIAPPMPPTQEQEDGEKRHSARKSSWSEEPEEKRFNEGVITTPHETTLDPPHHRRSTAGLPPLASSSRASSARRPPGGRDGDDDENIDNDRRFSSDDFEDDDDEPVFDKHRPRPAARSAASSTSVTPFAAQVAQRADSSYAPREVPPSPMQAAGLNPHPPVPASSHPDRQSIRRDSEEERELRNQRHDEEDEEDAVLHPEDSEDEDEPQTARAAPTGYEEEPRRRSTVTSRAAAPASRRGSHAQPSQKTPTSPHDDGVDDEDGEEPRTPRTPPQQQQQQDRDWTHDVYDENDPDVWGPPYKPPTKKRQSKKAAADQNDEHDGDSNNNNNNNGGTNKKKSSAYDENDPDVWGPPYKPPTYDSPKKKRKSSAKPATRGPDADEHNDDDVAARQKRGADDAGYDRDDPDVWGPPYKPPPQKRKSSARRRPTNVSSTHPTEADSRSASYVVPFSTATSRMRAFYGNQKRAERERTASQDARLRLAARPATSRKDGDVFRAPRRETFVDPGPQELEGVVVDPSGEPVEDVDGGHAADARAPSQFKRHDSAHPTGGSRARNDANDWNYRFPISPSRAAAGANGEDDESLAGDRQASPAPKPYMADVLPRDGGVQTPSVSPASQALDSQHTRHSQRPEQGSASLRSRPSVIRPGLGYEPPHPKIRTRSRSYAL